MLSIEGPTEGAVRQLARHHRRRRGDLPERRVENSWRERAESNSNDDARSINEVRRWSHNQPVSVKRITVAVQCDGICDLYRSNVGRDLVVRLLLVDADKRKASGLTLIRSLQEWHLGATGHAIGRPEVEY